MKATEELVQEHEAVLVALAVLDKVVAALGVDDARAIAHLEQLLDFCKGFVDRCHHAKEEEVLFPELERRGVQREGGPIGVMLREHEEGRGYVRALTEGCERLRRGDATAAATIGQHAHGYRDLLQAHIHKENTILFPMADRFVPDDVAAHLAEQFEAIERERVGEGKHEAYHALLHDLKAHYAVA